MLWHMCVHRAASWVVECNGCGRAAILGAFSQCVCTSVCHQHSTGALAISRGVRIPGVSVCVCVSARIFSMCVALGFGVSHIKPKQLPAQQLKYKLQSWQAISFHRISRMEANITT